MYNNLYDDGLENEIKRKLIKDLWRQHADNVNFDLTTGRLYADPNDPENDWNRIDLNMIDPYVDKNIIDIMPDYKRKEYQTFLQGNDKAGFDYFNKMYGNILAPVPEVEPKPNLRPKAQVDINSAPSAGGVMPELRPKAALDNVLVPIPGNKPGVNPLNNIKIANSDLSSFVPDESLLLSGLIEIQKEASRQNEEIYKKKMQKYAPVPDSVPETELQETSPNVLTGSVTQLENKNPHPIRSKITQGARNTARFLLPKPIENWYLGSKEDEDFLKKNQNSMPTYEQLNNDYKNGAISKEEYMTGIQDRSKLNRIEADREYTDTRNLDIGKGVIDMGFVPIGGPAVGAGKVIGTKVLPKVAKALPKVAKALPKLSQIGKKVPNGVKNAAVDISKDTLTSATEHMAIDPNAEFGNEIKDQAIGSTINYGIDKGIRKGAKFLISRFFSK